MFFALFTVAIPSLWRHQQLNIRRIAKIVSFVVLTGLVLLTFQITLFAADSAPAPSVKLLLEDCAKCHSKPPDDIAADGRKHKTEIGCQDCHNGHPPTTRNIIPLCIQCHEGKPHFRLTACMSCHKNPHTPLKITYGNNVTDACLTCHAGQIIKLRENKSKHTALACSFCHSTHGKIPECTQCHKPHSAGQTIVDCLKCHQAHSPKNVAYNDKTPSKDCAGCHKKAYELLTASSFKHKNLNCAACHQAKHKMVPQCQTCHGNRHPAVMMAFFPKCSICHNIAHDLNNFTIAPSLVPSGGVAPAAKKPRKK
jgi:predicted CXXCH cytochrome family protein